jgi:peptidoglycan-associated lipoprotein
MRKYVVLGLALIFCLVMFAGCKKRTPAVTRTPEAPAPQVAQPTTAPGPTIELSASPSTVERGQQTSLSWKADNAASVLIDAGVGNVGSTGSMVISPRESTTFTATATGPGGEAKASTRVTVVDAAGPGIIASSDIDGLLKAISEGKVRPVFFAYDKAELSEESRRVLQENARWFRQFPGARVIVEGHCDERGTEEYNLALGDRRALATRDFLTQLGVNGEQLETISYGEEKPFAMGQDEASYAQNRRAHFNVRR